MSPRPRLFRRGRIVDPTQGLDDVLDLLIADGKVAAIGAGLEPPEEAEVTGCEGRVLVPGLIDVHVHLREPGGEHKETIETGARAAAAGGFTSVCAMPNTDPVIDSPAMVGFVAAAGRAAGLARVYPVGALSVGQKGERLTEIGELVGAGAVAITDDGNPIMDSGLMRMALEYAQAFGVPVADHAEDLGLSRRGAMNEGLVSARLGLPGKPNASEDIHIARDLLVAELTGGHIHLQHVSTRLGVGMIRQARERGVRVTAEATPHHLLLTDGAVDGYRTEAKMNPPLRTESDRIAVEEGFIDGTLDTLATDHAPHHYDEKEQAFDDAPFGVVGLETAPRAHADALRREREDGSGDARREDERSAGACVPARGGDAQGGGRRRRDPHRSVDPVASGLLAIPFPESEYTLRGDGPDGKGELTLVDGRVVHEAGE